MNKNWVEGQDKLNPFIKRRNIWISR